MTDVAQSTEPEIAEIERAEIKLRTHFWLIKSEVAEVRFVDVVFSFVVVVVLIVVSIADASMIVKQMNVFVFVLMLKTEKIILCWFDDIFFNFNVEKSLFSNRIFCFLLCYCLIKWRMNVNHLKSVFFFDNIQSFFSLFISNDFFFKTFSSALTVDILMSVDIHTIRFFKKKRNRFNFVLLIDSK